MSFLGGLILVVPVSSGRFIWPCEVCAQRTREVRREPRWEPFLWLCVKPANVALVDYLYLEFWQVNSYW